MCLSFEAVLINILMLTNDQITVCSTERDACRDKLTENDAAPSVLREF